MADPIVLLDAAAHIEHVLDIGDIFARQIGNLFDLDQVHLLQTNGQFGRDRLDLRQIFGLTLGLLESLPGGVELARANISPLDDTSSLAAQFAQIVQFGATDFAASDHFDLGDIWRINGKYALDAFTVRNLADRKALVDATTRTRNAHALIGL